MFGEGHTKIYLRRCIYKRSLRCQGSSRLSAKWYKCFLPPRSLGIRGERSGPRSAADFFQGFFSKFFIRAESPRASREGFHLEECTRSRKVFGVREFLLRTCKRRTSQLFLQLSIGRTFAYRDSRSRKNRESSRFSDLYLPRVRYELSNETTSIACQREDHVSRG